MSISRGTQQRLVQRHSFELPTVQEVVEEISIDQDLGRTHEFELTHLPESLEEMSIDQDKERTHELELPTIQEVVEEISINPDKERTHEFELTHLPESLEEMSIDQDKERTHKFGLAQAVEEMSIDGGKVRLRTPLGQPCEWRDYKAVNLHGQGVAAFFRDNTELVKWVNQQPLANPLVSLGDGHDGVWNLFALDWSDHLPP